MKRTVTCTTPYGVVTRTTARIYTHAVVVRVYDGGIRAMAWCGSRKLAEGQLKYWQSHLKYRFPADKLQTSEMGIFPVDGAEGRDNV